MVHVLLSMDKPVGSAGETVQEVAPVTLVMPPPEPLLNPVEEFHVLVPETATGECWLPVVKPPLPNCPKESRPQHFMSPLSRITQVWDAPADNPTALRPVPKSIAVAEGALVSTVLPPSPNCP